MVARKKSTVIADEVAQFSRVAGAWWDADGPMRPLHLLNPVRVGYVRDRVAAHFGRAVSRQVFKGLSLLDVGCGGGLLTEPFARLGARVTGLDASEAAIAEARRHAAAVGVEVDYQVGSVEEFSGLFDVITALEIVEHVADLDLFIAALARLLKPDGILILSTLNRTPKSFFLGIVAAEYVLRWVPKGTHDWRKFVKPSELAARLERNGMKARDLIGVVFDPVEGGFVLSERDVGVNYIMAAGRG